MTPSELPLSGPKVNVCAVCIYGQVTLSLDSAGRTPAARSVLDLLQH